MTQTAHIHAWLLRHPAVRCVARHRVAKEAARIAALGLADGAEAGKATGKLGGRPKQHGAPQAGGGAG